MLTIVVLLFWVLHYNLDISTALRTPTVIPTATPPCSSPLNCFHINIPDFCVNSSIASNTVNDNRFLTAQQASSDDKLCLSNLVCQDFTITGFPSSYSPLEETTLNLGITGIGASCAGQFALKTSSIITSKSGSASISITSLNITLSVNVIANSSTTTTTTTTPLPVAASFPRCNVSKSDITIQLKIGITPVQTIDPVKLENALQADLDSFICTNLTTTLANTLTERIETTLDPRLTSLLSQKPDPLPDKYTQAGETTYVNWDEPSSLVNKVHSLLKRLVPTLPPSTSSSKTSIIVPDKGNMKRLSATIFGDRVASASSEECISIPMGSSWVKDLVVPDTSTSKIAVTTVKLCGLSSIETFYLLEPVSYSNVTLLSEIQWEYLSLELSLDLTSPTSLLEMISPAFPPHTYTSSSASKNYSESLTISLAVRNVTLMLDAILAMDAQILNALYLDQVALGSGCWLSGLTELSVSSLLLQLNITELKVTQISGSAGNLQSDVVALFDNVFLLLIDGFGPLLTDVIAGFAQGPIRNGLNNFLNETISSAKEGNPCKEHNTDVDGYAYWQNTSFVQLFDKVVNDMLGASGLNSLVDVLTNGTGAADIVLGQGGGAINLALSGLDSFYEVALLHPRTPTSSYLDNSLALGQCDSSSCKQVVVTLEGGSSVQSALSYVMFGDGGSGSGRRSRLGLGLDLSGFKLSVSLSNMRLSLALLMQVSLGTLANLTFSQLGTTGCVASSVDTFSLQPLQFNISQASISLEDVGVEVNITDAVTRIISAVTARSKVLTTKNAAVDESLSKAGETCANGGVYPFSADDDASTGSSSSSSSSAVLPWVWQLVLVILAGVTSLVVLLWSYRYWGDAKCVRLTLTAPFIVIVSTTKLTDASSSSMATDAAQCEPDMVIVDGTLTSRPDASTEDDLERVGEDGHQAEDAVMISNIAGTWWDRWDMNSALLFEKRIPLIVRLSVPLVLFACIALFIDSNMTPDAVSVMLEIDLGQKTITPGSVFDFGLGNTVQDMWEAEVYALAILIAVFSGAWPYIKLLFMLFAWTAPSSLLSVPRRETGLKVLDALGKWSLVDFYVMILFLCAFYLELKLGSNLVVKVTVLPKWGFDGFLLATMLSLSMGHIILACHRLLLENDQREIAVDPSSNMSMKWESLSSMTYEVAVPPSQQQQQATSPSLSMSYNALYAGDPSLPSPSAAAQTTYRPLRLQSAEDGGSVPDPSNMTGLFTQNTTIASKSAVKVRVTRFGVFLVIVLLVIATVFLIAGTNRLTTGFQFKGLTGLLLRSNAKTQYSVIGVGLSAPAHSGVPNSFAIHWIQASFFLLCLGMPLALIAACFVLWVCPMPLSLFKQIFVLTEVFNAWSALDVYCVAIAAAILEIQQFAAFIVGDSCDGINKLLEKFLDSQLEGDDLCFDVVAVLLGDCWVLFLAAALLIVVGWPTLSLCSALIEQRTQERNSHTAIGTPSSQRSFSLGQGDVAIRLQEPLLSEVDNEGEDGGVAEVVDRPRGSGCCCGEGDGEEGRRVTCCTGGGWLLYCIRGFAYIHVVSVE